MLQDVVVPEVSDGVSSGTVISVAVAVGDRVEEDQTLLELETDKAVVAIPAPVAGTIAEIKVGEGDEAVIGAVIMTMEPESARDSAAGQDEDGGGQSSDEQPSDERRQPAAETQPAVSEPEPEQSPEPADIGEPTGKTLDLTPVRRGGQVAPAAPSVRRFARELGVDIDQVEGSGPGGRINENDIRRYVRGALNEPVPAGARGTVPGGRPLPDFSQWGSVSREPFSKIRELTADAMTYAWTTIPMVTQYDKARVGKLEQFRRQYNRNAAPEKKLTMTAILLKICAAALKTFPQFNSSVDIAARELILKQFINIGVAVDTPNGLLVPVLRNVEAKSVSALAVELNEIAARTRERKVSPAELDGGTFTISNLGGIGGTAFTPLVYAPQVAILGVSTAVEEPFWNGREFVPELTMPLSLTYDHRVIDGADGARFLRWICEAVDNPLMLVLED